MSKKAIITKNAPEAVGPYSQAVQIGRLLFASGQVPVDSKTGEIVAGGVEEQAKQVLENLYAVLRAAGGNFSDVVKTTVFIKNMDDFAKVNEIYASYFSKPYPARSCVEVTALPKGALIGIELVAEIA
jgi:2-iminobutanoate/2-iminopropanoate deaminase